MLVRQVVIPVSPDRLWDALTEAESVGAWFGSQVQWDLRPGGAARFVDDDGTVRGGVIVDVRPGRHLRFRWWPEAEDRDGARATSEVNYDLEPDEDGTRLTVTEEPAAAPAPTAACTNAQTSTQTSTQASTQASTHASTHASTQGAEAANTSWAANPVEAANTSWADWDSRLFRCWAREQSAQTRVLVAVSGTVGRAIR